MPDSDYASPSNEKRLIDREGNFHEDAPDNVRVHTLIDNGRIAEAVRELALAAGLKRPEPEELVHPFKRQASSSRSSKRGEE